MSRNGSGTYQLPAGNPVVPSTVISSTWANTTLNDIGTALTQSIANDGQTTPVANLPMATFRHTSVGNAVARNDYAAAGQVQDSSLQWLTSIAGTDTITASITPSPTVYVAGQTFSFIAAGTNTTNAVTLNINGLGAKSITKNGTSVLQAGDIASGSVTQVTYDGTRFQLVALKAGCLINIQTFTANGTYTPTPGTNSVIVEIIGGGGAGGGSAATAAGQISMGAGGGAGGYSKGRLTSGFSGAAVVIGAGGTGVSGAAGNNGGNSTFGGALLGGNGGTGGGRDGGAPPPFVNGTVGVGGAAAGGSISNSTGAPGTYGVALGTSAGQSISGSGANTVYGSGGASTSVAGIGNTASGFGSGGGGALTGVSAAANTGGAGRQGICIVYEFS